MTSLRISLLIMLIISAMAVTSEAGWLIFHESEIKGQILDIDTKQPIEGAVVVIVYRTANPGMGAGQGSSVIDVRETLTDKEGKFLIPSYTTIIQPFSWKIPGTVLIFKPGYPSLELHPSFFVGEHVKDEEGTWYWSKELKYKLRGAGTVELPKAKTKDEKWHSSFVGVSGYTNKELPLLYKARDEADKALSGSEK
jgi:hypothetical protein